LNESEQENSTVVTDEEVPSRIRYIIESAEEEVILVSPYVDNWQRLFDWLPMAVKKGVNVLLLTRRDEGRDGQPQFGGTSGAAILARLAEEGVEVRWLEKLHSKIYANENEVVVTSMNLLASSAANSKEIGLSLTNGRNVDAVRQYLENLSALSQPFAAPSPKKSSTNPVRKKAKTANTKPAKASKKTGSSASTTAHCIRCETTIPFSMDRPLCDKDYKIWAQYEDPDYQETYCHSCGKERETSYAKPVCLSCFKKNSPSSGAKSRSVPPWFRKKKSS
jgi:hypothetical protein